MSGMLQAIQDLLITPPRSFGELIPSVVVEEAHFDTLAITEHPIEAGAPIADHAYMRPAEVKMRCAWSPSSPAIPGPLGTILPISQGLVSGLSALFNGGGDYLKDVYEQLLTLQKAREPFELTTGKRTYQNMLIESLAVETDRFTEYVLMVAVTFREVIIVKTLTATATTPQADQEAQAAPEETAPAQDRGQQQPTEAPASASPAAPPSAPPATPATPPTPDWNSPTGWRNSAGIPVEASGAPQAPPIR